MRWCTILLPSRRHVCPRELAVADAVGVGRLAPPVLMRAWNTGLPAEFDGRFDPAEALADFAVAALAFEQD